jgi:AraC-like DNA-binding protein
MRLIVEEGALDEEGATVESLAGRLGMGGRQLARLFARYIKASPVQVCGSVTMEPIRLAICHCKECQRQSGSAFGKLRSYRRRSYLKMTSRTEEIGSASSTYRENLRILSATAECV